MKLDTLRIDAISTFIEIVEAGGLGAAGRRLGISKSLVSKRLAGLEAALNVRLLNRSTRQIALTESGQYFFDRCHVLLSQFQAVSEELADQSEEIFGRINIAVPLCVSSTPLSRALNVFAAQFPSLTLQLSFADALPDLIAAAFDVALAIGRVPSSSLIIRRLAVSENVLVCSGDYALRHGIPASIDEIEHHLFAGMSPLPDQAEWQFRRGGEARAIAPKVRIRANTRLGQFDAARDGLAIAALPAFMVHDAVRNGVVQVIDIGWDLVPDDVCLLYPERRYISRKVRALSMFIAEQVTAMPHWRCG